MKNKIIAIKFIVFILGFVIIPISLITTFIYCKEYAYILLIIESVFTVFLIEIGEALIRKYNKKES